MKLSELKKHLTTGALPSEFIVFINAKDSTFLANQYLQTMVTLAPGGRRDIKSIYEPLQSTACLLLDEETTLNVLRVETFDERAESYDQFDYTVVICDKIDKSIAKVVEPYTIQIPTLEPWQILDYSKQLCKGLSDADLNWLIENSNGNIDCVLNELDKIKLFSKDEQYQIFSELRAERSVGTRGLDFNKTADAIVYGDTMYLFNLLASGGAEVFEPVGLANRAFNSLKAILLATQNPTLSAEDLGMSAAQCGYLRRNSPSLNVELAQRKLKFLATFDFDLKTSKLDLSKQEMLNYLLANTAYRITR